MRRLYYVADDLRTCELVAHALEEEGVRPGHFHVLSKDAAGLVRHHVQAATPWQQHDVVRTSERWGLAGLAAGLLFGLLAYLTQLVSWPVSGFDVGLIALVGGLFGAWRGALAGRSREHYKVAPFHDDLEAGRHLVMVDVDVHTKPLVRERMNLSFPQVTFCGRDTTLVTPFATSRTPRPAAR